MDSAVAAAAEIGVGSVPKAPADLAGKKRKSRGEVPEVSIDMLKEVSSKHAWIKCNDESLTVVSEDEVLKSSAYVLFYSNNRATA